MKRLIRKAGIVLFVMLFLPSCDHFNQIDGLVTDDLTNEPIDSALVSVRFNDHVLDSFNLVQDSLPKAERKKRIKAYGNEEKWMETGAGKMVRWVPVLTNQQGRFDIAFTVGVFPRYTLCIERAGYVTFELKNSEIDGDESPRVFRMKRSKQ
jgi:hypothetical protein